MATLYTVLSLDPHNSHGFDTMLNELCMMCGSAPFQSERLNARFSMEATHVHRKVMPLLTTELLYILVALIAPFSAFRSTSRLRGCDALLN